jgi:hypothetical protein
LLANQYGFHIIELASGSFIHTMVRAYMMHVYHV